MATKYFNVRFSGNEIEQPVRDGDPFGSCIRLAGFVRGLAGGSRLGAVAMAADTSASPATGTLTLSSASGTVGGTINGVSVTVAASGGDTATAAAIAAAINASGNALVNKHVTATSALGVVTITAITPGFSGNAITLAASGTNVTASGARLTDGTATAVSNTF